eukprot:340668-Chlamydomonas_euryale.AAC.3
MPVRPLAVWASDSHRGTIPTTRSTWEHAQGTLPYIWATLRMGDAPSHLSHTSHRRRSLIFEPHFAPATLPHI